MKRIVVPVLMDAAEGVSGVEIGTDVQVLTL